MRVCRIVGTINCLLLYDILQRVVVAQSTEEMRHGTSGMIKIEGRGRTRPFGDARVKGAGVFVT